MSRIRQTVLLGVVCLVSLGAGYFANTVFDKRATDRDDLEALQRQLQSESGKTLPATMADFTLIDTFGKQRSSDEWAGKVLIINFWATWCEPCREEMPLLADFRDAMLKDNVEVIGIAIDDPEPVRTFGDSHGISYPLLIAGKDDGYQLLEPHNSQGVLPFSLVVDRVGNIIQRKLGIWTRAELKAAVRLAID